MVQVENKARGKKSTLKRDELYRVHKLLEEALTLYPNKLCRYKGDASDDSIAALATEQLRRDIDAKLICRVRVTTFGKLPHEGGSTREAIEYVMRENDSLRAAIKSLTARMDAFERDLYEDPPKPAANGHAGHKSG